MRIAIVIPHIYIGGGIRVSLEYANHLQRLGHQVTVVYPRRPPYYSDVRPHWRGWGGLLRRVRYDLRYWTARVLRRQSPSWFPLMVPLHRVPDLQPQFIPTADIILAVDWTTAEGVNRSNPKKGLRFYLIQGHDVWLAPPDRVEATWHMPLHKIVVSSWLKELVREKSGRSVYGPILNGVNLNQFCVKHKRFNIRKRIGMVYHANPIKGVKDGLAAFEMARAVHPDIQLVMFGTREPKLGLPRDVEFHENPPQYKLREIYGSCDIWLSPSHSEGFGLVPMEAMACQCAVVTTNVGGIQDYTVPGQTALVSLPREPAALGRNLIWLLDDEEELKRIAQAGHKHIQAFTWERAARQMEQLFEKMLRIS
jgi:glycosyltransferase involved in cell wall biosynthesis